MAHPAKAERESEEEREERMEHHPSIAFFQRRRRNQTQIAISPIQQLPGTSEMERERAELERRTERAYPTDGLTGFCSIHPSIDDRPSCDHLLSVHHISIRSIAGDRRRRRRRVIHVSPAGRRMRARPPFDQISEIGGFKRRRGWRMPKPLAAAAAKS